jgi:hypothetical protein
MAVVLAAFCACPSSRASAAEGLDDAEFHSSAPRYTGKTFITSSPKWLITLTAIRPVSGLGKGREVSR